MKISFMGAILAGAGVSGDSFELRNVGRKSAAYSANPADGVIRRNTLRFSALRLNIQR
jgi:hypothetical protein